MPGKRYWQSLEELEGIVPAEPAGRIGSVVAGESTGMGRREFLGLLGISAASFAAACSKTPVHKAIPYLIKPEEVTPGLALWYASTCGACAAGCGILAKARDGRPIKIEGNDSHPVSAGGLCPVGQAAVLSLYDAARLRAPLLAGSESDWPAVDAVIRAGLAGLRERGKALRVVTPTVIGPTLAAAVAALLAANPGSKRVLHDAVGHNAIAHAHVETHGIAAVPWYHFDRARVIASFGADFLGTWLHPVAHTKAWAAGRFSRAGRNMSRHWQIESAMTLSGANADRRIPIAPSDELPVLLGLAARLAKRANIEGSAAIQAAAAGAPAPVIDGHILDVLADDLWTARGTALVVCGRDHPAQQTVVNAINTVLGAYGTTIDLAAPAFMIPGDADDLATFLDEIDRGAVGGVIFVGVNPVYDHPRGRELADRLGMLGLTASTADRIDETAAHVRVVSPDHHFLESWGDHVPRAGVLGLAQPAVRPLFATRASAESLANWAGKGAAAYDLLRARWERDVWPAAASPGSSFQSFWDRSVHDGYATLSPPAGASGPAPASAPPLRAEAVLAAARAAGRPARDGLEIALFESPALRDGRLSNNGWLEELPDPITKATWGNHALLAPATAARLGLVDGDVVRMRAGDTQIELPVLVQPGTHARVVAVALGYGRTRAGSVGSGVGANAFALAGSAVATLTATGRNERIARSQTHNSQEGRRIVRETRLEEALVSGHAGNDGPEDDVHTLWKGHEYPRHRWVMAIDLSACTGCSACVVSCQVENNIPVVGRDEVWRRREMHWLRIDRYYEGHPGNPRTAFQPMLCQHCENAPCETVCPVLATVHSDEGLNQQVYNRCVGTRYCANNCPYKVRRFNWFDYPHDDALANMVLNPDVTVRSRGVMEKCTFCVQRIQEAKARAKDDERPVRDGDVKPACAQSCAAGAIVFGDLGDPGSAAARLVRSGRAYRVLGEMNLRPSVSYLVKVRNPGREDHV